MEIMEFIIDEALILIPVLLILGKFIKNTPNVSNWVIPYILLILGIVLANALMGVGVDAIIQGVLIAGAAVFTHQLIKQQREKE